LEYNFNNPFAPGPVPDAVAPEVPAAESTATPAAEAALSPGFTRFRSCRWQQPSEEGSAEFCTHREVKPYAGASNFDANAWCPDCVHFKLRRTPKKRSPDDYAY
jgi:hypothetical protein